MQLIVYTLVQCLCMCVDLLVYMIIINATILPLFVANSCGKFVGVLLAFFAHRAFTFRLSNTSHSLSSTLSQASKYLSTLPVNILFSTIFLYSFFYLFNVELVAKLLSDFVTFFLFFAVNKKVVFK